MVVVVRKWGAEARVRGWEKMSIHLSVKTVCSSRSGSKLGVNSYQFSLIRLSGYRKLDKSLISLVFGVLICKGETINYDSSFKGRCMVRAQ
jgi:hypothetical protein